MAGANHLHRGVYLKAGQKNDHYTARFYRNRVTPDVFTLACSTFSSTASERVVKGQLDTAPCVFHVFSP